MTSIAIPTHACAMIGPPTFTEQLRQEGIPEGSRVSIRNGQLSVDSRPQTSTSRKPSTKAKPSAAKYTAEEIALGPNRAKFAAGIKFRKPKPVKF